ncbi:hypothetical protein [Agrobacterium sp. DSM 25558]|uniref:hypothetical protein n=1 Tax=Agrobacterium sp. DSM 25558 TaxID=1907665 RepID=UPI001177AEB5|nr:hypothetical protein [Agrobacterium sp. DSM 25558]
MPVNVTLAQSSGQKSSHWGSALSGFVGALIGGLAVFGGSLYQTVAQREIARDNIAVERDKLALGRDSLKLEGDKLASESDKLALERDRFNYVQQQDLRAALTAKTRSELDATIAAQRLSWDEIQLNKNVELQNQALLAQTWSSCLNATALVRQPVSLPSANPIGTPTVGAGEDSIKCMKKFEDFNPRMLETLPVPVKR